MAIDWSQPQPAPLAVWDVVNSNFPQTRFLGIMREPGHQDHSEGRALDIGLNAFDSEERATGYELVRIFRKIGSEVGWSYLIWNRQIWYNDARGGPHDKGFQGAHTDHIHVSWSQAKSQKSNFPLLVKELAASAALGGVEDDTTQASYYRPYSS